MAPVNSTIVQKAKTRNDDGDDDCAQNWRELFANDERRDLLLTLFFFQLLL